MLDIDWVDFDTCGKVKSLLVQNNLPTDLQLHCYMRELVKAKKHTTWT